MPLNLEIKARIENPSDAAVMANSIGAEFSGDLLQVDTYFKVPEGRLKLRRINDTVSELIFYEREENGDRRYSKYEVHETGNPESLTSVLSLAVGIRCVVKKRRTMYMFRGARIHLDQVEGLGTFLEFEVPVEDSREKAEETLEFLISAFRLGPSDFFRNSYVDLKERENGEVLTAENRG